MPATILVLDDNGVPQTVPTLPPLGTSAAAGCLPAVLANDIGLPYPGATPPIVSASATASLIIRTTPGVLLSLSVSIGTVTGWVMIFDQTTVPADGAVAPKWFSYVKSDGTGGEMVPMNWGKTPLYFASGIVAVFSSTGPYSKTASATASFKAQVTAIGAIVYSIPKLITVGFRTPVSDANYAMATTDSFIGYTSISTARTVTLVAASSFIPGQGVLIADESGSATGAHKITALRSGTDLILGTTSLDVVTAAFGSRMLISNGLNAWFTS